MASVCCAGSSAAVLRTTLHGALALRHFTAHEADDAQVLTSHDGWRESFLCWKTRLFWSIEWAGGLVLTDRDLGSRAAMLSKE